MHLPVGHTIYLWRVHRRLTQDALAQRARLPRPNLSAIERGRQNMSVPTLRALAQALDIRPGLLVDGVAPPGLNQLPLSPSAIKRIAKAVVRDTRLERKNERSLASLLRQVTQYKRALMQCKSRDEILQSKRRKELAWIRLRASCTSGELRALSQRMNEWWSRLAL